jgi:hypothetical protein
MNHLMAVQAFPTLWHFVTLKQLVSKKNIGIIFVIFEIECKCKV